MTPREFAIQVVQQLQQAGFQALWAGGCVRDQLLGREPKDYDVATSATPAQVRAVFGRKRTIPIGSAFGVITVLGPGNSGQIEVATFRRDSGYSDGRHPDSVEFTDAREDACRRDFTINGMFFDPVAEQVIDYVGGQQDLAVRQVRAIGNPHDRIHEDKLRMLRGVRFASTFGFALEARTMLAIQEHASEINVVSGERIGQEMRRMLGGPHRAIAARLLRASGLLAEILHNGDSLYASEEEWNRSLAALEELPPGHFESAGSILLEPIISNQGIGVVFERWKLSNDERNAIDWISQHWPILERANRLPWSQVQPLLLNRNAENGLAVAQAISQAAVSKASAGVEFCRKRLLWPAEKLDPMPLLDGRDLIEIGIAPGPQFKSILNAVRVAQLEGQVDNSVAAMDLAQELAQKTE